MTTFIVCLAIAYLIGSLSTSIIIAKVSGKSDPRDGGSGNAGATNVLRQHGKLQALIVLVGDVAKGLIAVWIAHAAGLTPFQLGLVGLAAMVGHVFPCYFKFKGGKGVATALGVAFGLSFTAGLIVLVAWIVITALTRYVSLASLIGAILMPFLLAIFGAAGYFVPGILMAVLILWRHLDNIKRLKAGNENKINLGKYNKSVPEYKVDVNKVADTVSGAVHSTVDKAKDVMHKDGDKKD